MKTVTINFEIDNDFDVQECLQALSHQKAFTALDEVTQQIFRPARKHGYSDRKIQELLEKCGDDGYELVSKLEELYRDILEENEISNLLY